MFHLRGTRTDTNGQRVGRPTYKKIGRLDLTSLLDYQRDLYRQLHTEGGDMTANREKALSASIEKANKEIEKRGL